MSISSDGVLAFGVDIGEVENMRECPHEDGWSEWIQKEFPSIEVVLHCSFDYPMLIIAVRDTCVTAYRGCPKAVTPETPKQEKIDALKEVLSKLKPLVEGEYSPMQLSEPSWILTSLYG